MVVRRNSESLMGYKSPGVLLEVIVIKRVVKALALNYARGKRGTFNHSSLGQDATIQIRLGFWGDYPCDKIPGCAPRSHCHQV